MEVENHEKRKSLDFLEIRPIFLKTDRDPLYPFPDPLSPKIVATRDEDLLTTLSLSLLGQ
jgi:hypothetical protein